ncbi:TetR/AcrR family transcriptional regulator [Paenibacillus rhizophilus]|uniref:TetR/AcrR family transcriptional regulator n=1 Tax=Paenibacillus rhizophilus TaxID=1850366 RepID=A0A3N9P0H7_9BACL|nr:TetR/AcrR family transcriptional regulator [Paenibacillus rhizophilus]RQW09673.1 TetR/AcrR family transcriptional regulator [Paenibacillus rhizophilus]
MSKSTSTKEKIIEAAYKILAERGLHSSSIKDIASEAGVAPGLIHYYFASKEELFITVIELKLQKYRELRQNLSLTAEPSNLLPASVRLLRDRVKSDPNWYRLRYEFYSEGLKNPEITERVATFLEVSRNGTSEIIEEITGNSSEAKMISAILLSCMDGLALQKIMNPDFDIDGAYDLLMRMALYVSEK